MKRISIDTLTTARQMPKQILTPTVKSFQKSETKNKIQETVKNDSTKTEHSFFLNFSHRIFADCFPSNSGPNKQNKTYHKLRHHSLDKNNRQIQQKFDVGKKTLSLNDSFVSFGKEKNISGSNQIIVKQRNHGLIADLGGQQNTQKYNRLNWTISTQKDSAIASTINSMNDNNSKYLNSVCNKLYLSQDLKNTGNMRCDECIKKQVTVKYIYKPVIYDDLVNKCKQSSIEYKNVQNTKRLSTIDSVRMKQNLSTQQCQTNNQLQLTSILCQSIKINQSHSNKDQQNNQISFEFDHMKDSFIDNLNLSRKQQSFIDSKRKSFIRSKKNHNYNQQSPRFCHLQMNHQKNHKNQQNQEQCIGNIKSDSRQVVQQKVVRKKFKTLDECGYTIVSKYNNSSDMKSILQQSNIVFQASRDCQQPKMDNNKYPSFSQSQINHKDNNQNQKIYNSFIHHLNSELKSQIQMINPDHKLMEKKKVKSSFLRTNKTQSQKQITSNNNESPQIRFDLDTFIQYEPL